MTNPDALLDFISAASGSVPRLTAVLSVSGRPPAQHGPSEGGDDGLLAAVAYLGDESAFEQLYLEHAGAVNAAAQQICRNAATAEDVTQRTFMTLWERAPRLVTRSVRLRPWLVTVARNAAIDYVRAHCAYVPLDDSVDLPSAERAEDAALTNVLIDGLEPAIAALPREQREVIELRYFEGRTFAQIAELTGEPLGTVKSRARLAIGHLRNSIGE